MAPECLTTVGLKPSAGDHLRGVRAEGSLSSLFAVPAESVVRELLAVGSGLMLATNVSFVVVAAELGVKAGLLPSSVASSMVLAGLLSAVLFPALAQSVLARTRESSAETA